MANLRCPNSSRDSKVTDTAKLRCPTSSRDSKDTDVAKLNEEMEIRGSWRAGLNVF